MYDIKYHNIKDLVKDKILKILYTNTKNQKADNFTKGLSRDNSVIIK